jgi:hypothetical protein
MESTNVSNLFELQVDHNGSAYLKETARWAKFLAVLGFIFCGLFVVFALFAGTLMATFSSLAPGAGIRGGAFISIMYILCALLYFFPCLYLYNFGAKMQIALRANDQEQLNLSFKNVKSYFRFIGILTIIALGFMALGLIVAVIGLASIH